MTFPLTLRKSRFVYPRLTRCDSCPKSPEKCFKIKPGYEILIVFLYCVFSIKDVGVSFKQGSYLELRNPPNLLEQLATRTYVSMYFNISRSDHGRAFILYMGNEVKTHTK